MAGGGRGQSAGSRQALAAGLAKGIADRRTLMEAGMIAAHKWAAERRPVGVREHMPFAEHRTQLEVREHMERLDRDSERMAAMFAGRSLDATARGGSQRGSAA